MSYAYLATEENFRALREYERKNLIVPIIETAVGLWNVLDVAQAPRVERLVFGALDFALDTGMHDKDGAFDYVRSRIVIASKVAGIAAPVDFVTQIKPLLQNRCVNCHHSGAVFGDLSLENREALVEAG